MNVCIRRFTLCHLYGCDAQGPDVSYTVVADLLNYLGCHPEWSTDHSVSLCHGVLQSGNIYYPQTFRAWQDQARTPQKQITNSIMLANITSSYHYWHMLQFYRQLSSNSKVCQFGVSLCVKKDVSCFDVPMDLPHEVKILEPLQRRLKDGCNFIFCQLRDWRLKTKHEQTDH